MANGRKLPPPIDPKKEPITVHVLSGKLDSLFNNVKELVETTARKTENVLRKEIQDVQSELKKDIEITQHAVSEHTNMIKNLETEMKTMESHLSDKIDKVGEKVEGHETRLTAVEEKLETHLATHS